MIVDQLFSPKPLKEGGPYDLPGKDYDRPGDTPRRPRPQGDTSPRRHPDDPDFMDPDQRRLRADQARVRKANAEYQAKNKGVAEGNGRDLTNTPRDQFISRMTPSMDANALRQKVAKIVNSPGFTEDTILQIVDAGDNLSHPAGRYIQQAFYGLQYNLGKEYEDYPERVAEKLLSQFRSMLPAYRVAEATTDMPFGSVSIDQSNTSEKPQQYHYGTEPSDKEKRQKRLLDVRSRKQDLLSAYAQLGALRVEMIYGMDNEVFLNKEQLLDYFDHLVDDPALTPLEYAHQNGIPIDGLLKGMLRRAVQLGISALDVRKLWNSAKDKVKAKPGVAEGADRAVNDKGLTQQRWLQLVQTKFPTAKIVQAKMIDGPVRATLPDGRTLSWTKAEQDVAEKAGDLRPKLGTARDKGKSVRKWRNDRGLNEALLMEDPVYRSFKRIGGYIAERKMSEKEILDVFAQAEADMTNTGTGANRTMLGRGKDATSQAYTNVKDSINTVLGSIQKSAPVAGVDVAYNQATNALANVAGGQDGAVMQAIKKYRLLAKEYPKTQLFVKTALIALAGLATGGAALPVIAGLTAAVDAAIKGEKLSSIIGKGAGAGLMGLGAQEVSSMLSSPTGEVPVDQSLAPGEEVAPSRFDQSLAPGASRFDEIANNAVDYKVKPDDTLSDILADRKINPEAFKRLPGNEVLFSPDGNPNIIKAGQTIKLPDPADIADLNKMSFTTPSDPNLAKDFGNPDFYTGQYNQNSTSGLDAANNLQRQELGRLGSDSGMSAARVARDAVRESIKFKILPAEQLIDRKLTVLTWALNESVNRKSNAIHLTTRGVYTVFENIDRYRQAIVEYTQPGREQIPDILRPDAYGAPVQQTAQPGMIGRGLNALDRFTSRVGSGLSNFGRQFTTGVTKEKLQMNWEQDGKPTDSDQLAAWLVTQKVPQQVVTDVYGKMGIPYTTSATVPAAQPAAQAAAPKTGGASTQAYAGINPATKKPYTQQELRDKFYPEPAAAPVAPATTATATVTPGASGPGFDAGNVMSLPGMEKYAKKAATPPAKTPNFAGPSGYGKTTMTATGINPKHNYDEVTGKITPFGAIRVPRDRAEQAAFDAEQDALDAKKLSANLMGKAKPGSPYAQIAQNLQTPGKATINTGGPNPNAKKKLATTESRVFNALKKPVAEMLQMVETKEDVQRIKQFVDETFVRYGAVNESAFAMRDQILEHVTQAGAQRRRAHSQRMAT